MTLIDRLRTSLKARVVGWRSEARALGGELRRWRQTGPDLAWRAATWLVLAYAVVQAVHAYTEGFDGTLLERHAFRQTQTAISTYYMVHGGPLLAYETPVFGAPYSLPFEFPLYQWLVAILHVVGRVRLEPAGRAVSIAFFVLATFPFFRLMRRSHVSAASSRLALAVLLTAPEYLFWTRTFLIESTALFFSLTLLADGVEVLEKLAIDRRLAWLFASASLAVLVKVTTGFGYLVALGCISIAQFARDKQRRAHLGAYAAFAVSAFVLPAIPLLAWTRFADHLKSLNPLTANFITSSHMHDWNYGTWEQKTSLATWQTLWERTMDESFGTALGFVACAALALFGTRKLGTVIAVILGVLSIYGVFTNLHVVHDYYQYSTVALVVAVVGLGFGAAENALPRTRAFLIVMAAAMIFKSVSSYRDAYLPGQTHHPPIPVADFVRAHTPPTALVMIYGDDWSSLIPYYAERRALMDRWNHDPKDPVIVDALQRSAAAGNNLGAVVICHGERAHGREWAGRVLDHAPQCTAFSNCDVCL